MNPCEKKKNTVIYIYSKSLVGQKVNENYEITLVRTLRSHKGYLKLDYMYVIIDVISIRFATIRVFFTRACSYSHLYISRFKVYMTERNVYRQSI